jgi:hypothetical protein
MFTITTSVSPANSGLLIGAGTYNCDSTVALKVKANSGYQFSAWKENNVQISTDSNYTFSAKKDRVLIAEFAKRLNVKTIDASQFIYPNPASQVLFVKGIDQPTFAIYDSQGALVLNGIVVDGRINISTLPSGIYLIELYATNGESLMITKFVKE